jgi:ribosomal protein S18 acetylase RimI-like enzyme
MAAALQDAAFMRVVDLRQVRAGDLDLLLAGEVAEWEQKLDWDFRASAELVERFVGMHALTGYALVAANRVAGYVYYVCEERKGLIGDLYVLDEFRTEEAENLLLEPVLETLAAAPWVKRVESQLMMLSRCFERVLPFENNVRVYPRTFMEASLGAVSDLPPKGNHCGVDYHPWSDRFQEDAAGVIASSYRGHIDSDINDQYRSPAGARRFLLNIVQYPGCGTFFQPASGVAMDRKGRLCGICLASLVRHDVGHITQICVGPEVRGKQVGYELLRRSLNALARHGCRRVSLTVTSSNETAIRLYRSVGFEARREFAAYVWDHL